MRKESMGDVVNDINEKCILYNNGIQNQLNFIFQQLKAAFMISSSTFLVTSMSSASFDKRGLCLIKTQDLLFSMLPTTISTLYFSIEVFIFSYKIYLSVSSLNDTHKCWGPDIFPSILGALTSR